MRIKLQYVLSFWKLHFIKIFHINYCIQAHNFCMHCSQIICQNSSSFQHVSFFSSLFYIQLGKKGCSTGLPFLVLVLIIVTHKWLFFLCNTLEKYAICNVKFTQLCRLNVVCKLTNALLAFANISCAFYINGTLSSETEHTFESFLHTQNWISVLLPHTVEDSRQVTCYHTNLSGLYSSL